MAFELKEGQGSLFKNDRKEQDNHPDYAGAIMLGGVEHWLNAWVKTGAKGKFLSLSAKPKQPKQDRPPAKQERSSYDDRDDPRTTSRALDDEIPF